MSFVNVLFRALQVLETTMLRVGRLSRHEKLWIRPQIVPNKGMFQLSIKKGVDHEVLT